MENKRVLTEAGLVRYTNGLNQLFSSAKAHDELKAEVDNKVDQSKLTEVQQSIEQRLAAVEAKVDATITVSATEPETKKDNMVWLDMTNKLMKVYSGGTWITFGAVYQ